MPLKRRVFMKLLGLAPLVIPFVRVGAEEPRPVLNVRKPTEEDWQEAREYRGLVRLAQEPQRVLNRSMKDVVYSGGGAGGVTDAASGMQFVFHTKRVSLSEFDRIYAAVNNEKVI